MAAKPRRLITKLVSKKPAASAAAGSKFRTTPITNTIKRVAKLPKSAIIYQCEASKYWQFRVFYDGAQRKRTTKKTDEREAMTQARLIYASMLQETNSNPRRQQQLTSRSSLQVVADALWRKQAAMTTQGELHKEKNKKDQYIYNSRIKPFFKDYEIRRINNHVLELFKQQLIMSKLALSTQKGYLELTRKLLRQAVDMDLIDSVPNMPRMKTDDSSRGYFDETEYTRLWQTAKRLKDQVYEYKNAKGRVYRRTRVTWECYELIMFMRNTFIRPTDVKVLRHRDVHIIKKRQYDSQREVEFLELRHEPTKGHSAHMVSNENAVDHYRALLEERAKRKGFDKNEHLFCPHLENRDYALKGLARQFEVVLRESGLKTDREGKNRTLYSLRHTGITRAIRDGLSFDIIASNARTSTDMVLRFYGHIKSAAEMGTHMVDNVIAKEDYYAAKAAAEAAEAEVSAVIKTDVAQK
jgi:hypothetical protein